MASPAHGLTPRDEAGVLRDFYLLLWKQLDLRSGESNWFDIAAASDPELRARAKESLDQIVELHATPELLSMAEHDRERLREALQKSSIATAEVNEFKAYLRDRALDFAQQAARLR
jgi:hypothetical protein